VVTECWVRCGVSTRLVENLVQALDLTNMSKCQVSEMTKELDEVASGFRNRPLEQAPYTCLWLDAIRQRCRKG
jgi:transposase-like protein